MFDNQAVEIILNSFTFPILTNILSSFIYDKLLSSKDSEDSILSQTIKQVIDKYFNENIELNKQYFYSLFEDKEVINELENFKKGNGEISIELLSKKFIESGFYYESESEQIAKKIIINFFETLKENILNSKDLGKLFHHFIVENKLTDIIGILQSSTRKLDIIDSKIDSGNFINSEHFARLEEKIDKIDSIKNFSSLKSDFESNDLEFTSKFKIANENYNTQEFNTALKIYKNLINDYSNSAKIPQGDKNRLYKNAGLALINLGKHEEAISFFEEAVKYATNTFRNKTSFLYLYLLKKEYSLGLEFIRINFSIVEHNEEVKILKAEFLARENKIEEALKVFSEEDLNNRNVLFTCAIGLMRAGKEERALTYFQKLLELKTEDPDVYLEYVICRIIPKVNDLNKIGTRLKIKNTDSQSFFAENIEMLNNALSVFERQDNKYKVSLCDFYLGMNYSLIGNIEKAYEHFIKCKNANYIDEELHFNLGGCLLNKGKIKEAIVEFEKAYKTNSKITLKHLVNAYIFGNEFDKAENLLKDNGITFENLKEQLNDENFQLFLKLCRIYEAKLDYERIETVLSEVEKKFPYKKDLILEKVDYLVLVERISEAIEYLQNSISKVEEGNDVLLFELGNLFYEIGRWEEAEDIFIKFFNANEVDYIYRALLNCKYNQRKDSEVLEITTKTLEETNNEYNKFIFDIRANVFFNNEMYYDAIKFLKELAIREKNYQYFFNLAVCEFRVNNKDEALKILNAKVNEMIKNKEYEYLSRISGYLNLFDEKKRAIELSYLAFISNPSDYRLAEMFMHNCLTCLEKEIFDQISEEIKNQYHELLENWEEKYPESKFLKKIKIENDSVLKTLEKHTPEYAEREDIFDTYIARRLPFGSLVEYTGKTFFEIWYSLTRTPNGKIHVFSGNIKEFEISNLEKNNLVVVDPLCCITLTIIDKFNFLKYLFTNIYVPQNFLDELNNYKNSIQPFLTQERNSVVKIKGQIIPISISIDETKEEVKLIDKIINNIKPYVSAPIKSYIDPKLLKSLDKSSTQSLNLAIEKKSLLLYDDNVLFNFAPNISSELLVCSSFAFLNYFSLISQNSNLGLIFTQRELNKTISTLISKNYFILPINVPVILSGIVDGNFEKSSEALKTISLFKNLNYNKESTIQVVKEFIFHLFMLKMDEDNRNKFFDYTMDSLSTNESNLEKFYIRFFEIVTESVNTFRNDLKDDKESIEQIEEFYEWFKKIFETWKLKKDLV